MCSTGAVECASLNLTFETGFTIRECDTLHSPKRTNGFSRVLTSQKDPDHLHWA